MRSYIAVIFMLSLISTIQAQTPQETLNQYVSELQNNPNDYALREKIIKLVQTMKPAPAIPEEAKRYINRGVAAAEDAKNEKDFTDAAAEFQKAVNIAPWIGAAYRGLAITQDKAGRYSQALQNLKLFLLTNPSASDTEAAKTLLDKIEYRQEKAAKESSPEAVAAKKENDYEAWLKKLDGAQWRSDINYSGSCDDGYIEIHGQEIRLGWITVRPNAPSCKLNPRLGDGWSIYRGTIEGHNFMFSDANGTHKGTISEDGGVITVDFTPSASAPSFLMADRSSYTRVKNPIWTIWNRGLQ